MSNTGRACQHYEATSGGKTLDAARSILMAFQERQRESASPNLPHHHHWIPTAASHSSMTDWLLPASVFSFTRKLLGWQGRLYHGQ
ncbi:hypothetical protein DM01DRAFT_1333476 [Hesseltinella vesiculosa]|uniref:Uncharacterized protein n=1 Tax=Hesseltinella vesiculosa TaxID=101127 RepID=A0A1X2GQ36_9FUNG|nr:hypothetical protein DM01DRAFT_1333476 [Hesseltinella vesiculosa]